MDPNILSKHLNKSLIHLQTQSDKVHKEIIKKKIFIKKVQIEIENYNKHLTQLELDTKNANLQIEELTLRDEFEESNTESIEEANILLKTQLDDLVDEVKNINDNNEMIKNKCEEKLKWYREKLNTRVQHYKKLPKVQNIEKINQNIEDSECSNAKLQKEITNIKSEIGSMIKDTGLKYGSVVDWGVALASSMIKMKNSRRNYCEREERIKKLETRMNELEQKKNSIMEKQKIENENFTCKKITKGCSLIDSKIMKSSEMKSPLTVCLFYKKNITSFIFPFTNLQLLLD